MLTRSSGVLMHITSLPNAFGIGSFGQSAYDFVDFLVETNLLANSSTHYHQLW
jgi:4-alpha-glucanotransferase